MRMGSFTLGWVLSPKVGADHPKLVRHGRWKLTCQWFHRQTILNPGAEWFQGFYPKDMWIFFYQAYENEIIHFIADQSPLEIIDLVDYHLGFLLT